MTNTKKLRGSMSEHGYNLSTLAKAMGLSRPTMRSKIEGNKDFKVSEIKTLCALLEIKPADVLDYFFA